MNKKKKLPEALPTKKKIPLLFISFFTAFLIAISLPCILFCKPKNRIIRDSSLNLLLITIDTIRADRVGYSGYDIKTPHLDSLAFGGVRFMNAVCQVPLTLPSHASILTGTNPPFHRIKNNGTYYLKESFTTLAEILREREYHTAAFIGAFPLDSQFGLDQGFDIYDDNFRNPDHLKGYEPQRVAEQVFDSTASWFEKKSDKKFFVWVHYYDPHLPYTPPSPFDKKYNSPYDGEIAYTDVYVGKLVQLLKKKDFYEKTLIVVVGDHGEGLGDHKEDTHGIFLYDTTLKVPLLFHSPRVIPKGKPIKNQVRTVDIFPTILEILDIPVPEFSQGMSLIPVMEGKNLEIESYGETYLPLLACGWSELKSLRTNRFKFILAPRTELYDLVKDPYEKNNLMDKREMSDQWRNKLEALERKNSSPKQEEPSRRLSPEDQEKLAALGYVGGARYKKGEKSSIIDPKDKIQIFEETLKAELALSQGKTDSAEEILENLILEDPGNPMVHHFLGKAYQKSGKWEKSIEEFKEALKINPDDVYSHYLLAVSYRKTGNTEEAIREAKIVLAFFGRHLSSFLLLADIYGNSKDYKRAVDYLEKAIDIEPDNIEIRFLHGGYLFLAKDYEKAYDAYLDLLKKSPNDPKVYNGLGMISYFRGDYKKTIEYLLKETELHSNSDSYFILGIAYGKLEEYQNAVKYLEKHLDSIPVAEKEKRKRAESALLFFKSKL